MNRLFFSQPRSIVLALAVCALGAPADAAAGTIAIGNLGGSATLVYTGAAGDITDRVLNLSGSIGGTRTAVFPP